MKFDEENDFICLFFSGREWLRGLVTVEEDSTNWKVWRFLFFEVLWIVNWKNCLTNNHRESVTIFHFYCL